MNTCTKLKTAFVCLTIAGVFSGCVSSGPKHVKLATVDSSGTNVVHDIASGPFQPTWESLTSQYQTPDWFRDAKFGIGQSCAVGGAGHGCREDDASPVTT